MAKFKPIRAYHGSPHDFDRFDASKIGTGTGNNAFGHGIYLAGAEGNAKGYRDMLSPRRDIFVGGELLPSERPKGNEPRVQAIRALQQAAWGDIEPVDALRTAYTIALDTPDKEYAKRVARALDDFKQRGVTFGPQKGRMYQVEVDHPEESLLDLDLPMSYQPESVVKALGRWADAPSHFTFGQEGWLGRNAYSQARTELGSGQDASQELQKRGVPGARYLDNKSSNYVIFPGAEHNIRILRKYGFIPPALYAANSMANTAQASEPSADGTYEMPPGFGMAPSPSDERAIPVDNLPASDPAMARLTYDVKYEPMRQERIQQLIDSGVQKDVAALQATKEFELDRPTISPDAVRRLYPYYEGDQPISPRAFLKEVSELAAIRQSLQGKSPPPLDDATNYAIAIATGATPEGDRSTEGLDEIGQEAHTALLDVLQQHAPQGEYSDKSGISEAEFNSLQAKHGDSANFMYPDRLQPNFDALRQYELFTAGTSRHEPTQVPGIALRAMGGLFMPMRQDRAADFGNAMDMAFSPKAESTAREAMRWYESSRPDRDFDGYQSYRQPNNDAKFWTHSTTTLTGLGGAMGEDTSRRYGRWSAKTLPTTQDFSIPREQQSFLGQVRADTNRPVPIIREGLTPQDTQRFHESAKRYGQKSDSYLGAQFAKTVGEYPTPFAEGALNIFRNSGDPGTLASVAAGGVGGMLGRRSLIPALKGAGKGLVRGAGEEVLEGPVTDMFALPAFGYGVQEAFLNSPKENALAARPKGEDEVEYLHPKHPQFGQTVDRNMREAGEELGRESARYHSLRRSPLSGLR